MESTVKRQSSAPKSVPVSDRVTNMEATILAVMAEQSWAFTSAPVLVDLCKSLASDPEALNQLSVDRTSASIKMRYGLGKSFTNRTVEMMKTSHFSLNIDESTSSGAQRVLTILVNIFDESVGRVVMQHFGSVSLTRVDTTSVFDALDGLFKNHEVPWDHCMSILMDSCAVMRGSKNGLEQQIRSTVAKHLLDIDGDVCHHVHNATKKFCNPFARWVENMLTDIFNEFQWSSGNRDILEEISFVLNEKYTTPHHFASHRWLSCLDAAQSCLLQFRVLTVYVFGFLQSSDRPTYQDVLEGVCKDINREGRRRLQELHQTLKKKSVTGEGRQRRDRLVNFIFFHRKWTRMVLGVYSSVLPLLKEYVSLFQSASPMVHLLHDKQVALFKNFLSLFLKGRAYNKRSPQKLKDPKELPLDDKELHLGDDAMFAGRIANSILSACHPSNKQAIKFREQLREAYVQCAQYLQQKLPLDNELLQLMSALDPACDFSHEKVITALLKLPDHVSVVLKEEELQAFDLEVRRFSCSSRLPPYEINGAPVPVDSWWAKVSKTNDFPLLSRMAFALLTCFHGPSVESSFNVMGDVIDRRSSRMNIETYSAIQTCKYSIRAEGKSAVDAFRRKDKLYTPVNKDLCRLIRGANQKNREDQQKRREDLEEKRQQLSLQKQAEVSKQQAKLALAEAEKRARLAHRKSIRSKLEVLARKRRREKKAEHEERRAKRQRLDSPNEKA